MEKSTYERLERWRLRQKFNSLYEKQYYDEACAITPGYFCQKTVEAFVDEKFNEWLLKTNRLLKSK